jgi:hypothetical protein
VNVSFTFLFGLVQVDSFSQAVCKEDKGISTNPAMRNLPTNFGHFLFMKLRPDLFLQSAC